MRISLTIILMAGLAAAALTTASRADDAKPVLEFVDGKFYPAELDVTTQASVTVILRNGGTSAVEFESHALHLEKLLPPGTEVSIVLKSPAPGRYDFFDDFHPDAGKGVLVVK